MQEDAAFDEAKAASESVGVSSSLLPAFGLLQLRVGHDDDADEPVDQSYEITSTAIRTRGYEIGFQGISQVPIPKSGLNAPSKIRNLSSSSSSVHGNADELSKFVRFGGLAGKGSSGSVTKALRIDTWTVHALKAIGVHTQSKRKQLVKELDTFASLDCRFIVNFNGAFYDSGTTQLVLEYMNRGSLKQVLERSGRMSEVVLQRIAKQVLLGLRHMHARRRVHRDIKPGNILLNSSGEAKLADFGIAAELDGATNANTFVGTQVYMSPERIQSEPYGFPSDIWSFGLTLCTCALGSFPYSDSDKGFLHIFQTITNEPPPKLPRTRFSVGCRNFISKCLLKDPEQRWSAERLLLHPWVKDVNIEEGARWPWEADVISESDKDDLANAIKILKKFVFSRKKYERNEETGEKLRALSQSLNLPLECVGKELSNQLR